jgi:hypothetical protein
MTTLNYGEIFEQITKKSIPGSLEQIWTTVQGTQSIKRDIVAKVGSNLTLPRGNVFPIKKYSTDIDSFLE